MNFLRSFLHMLVLVLTVIPWALMVLAVSPFISRTRLYWLCVGWLRVAVHSGRWLLGIKNRVTGWEHLPAEGSPAVLLVKHQSAWETLALPTLLPRQLAFVFKKELLHIPFFGWGLGLLDMIHIDRSQGRQAFAKVVAQGRQFMDAGVWVIMFPEGTRIPRGQVGTYKTGGTRLAIAAGVPVIPVAVTSGRCWPRKAFIKKPGVVDISIGPPVASTGRDHEELMMQVQNWIEAEMRRLDSQVYGL